MPFSSMLRFTVNSFKLLTSLSHMTVQINTGNHLMWQRNTSTSPSEATSGLGLFSVAAICLRCVGTWFIKYFTTPSLNTLTFIIRLLWCRINHTGIYHFVAIPNRTASASCSLSLLQEYYGHLPNREQLGQLSRASVYKLLYQDAKRIFRASVFGRI